MPLAGFAAARGELSFPGVVVAGAAGAVVGTGLWYAAGRGLGQARLKRWAASHGRWLTLSPEDVDQASVTFRKYGFLAVFFGRLVPGLRTVISLPAGVSKMAVTPFVLWTATGTVLWTLLLASAGYLLEDQYDRVSAWLDPVTTAVLVLGALIYLYRLATFGREKRGSSLR